MWSGLATAVCCPAPTVFQMGMWSPPHAPPTAHCMYIGQADIHTSSPVFRENWESMPNANAILFTTSEASFPGASRGGTALQRLGQPGTDGSNLRSHRSPELRSHLIPAPALGEAQGQLEMLSSSFVWPELQVPRSEVLQHRSLDCAAGHGVTGRSTFDQTGRPFCFVLFARFCFLRL